MFRPLAVFSLATLLTSSALAAPSWYQEHAKRDAGAQYSSFTDLYATIYSGAPGGAGELWNQGSCGLKDPSNTYLAQRPTPPAGLLPVAMPATIMAQFGESYANR